MVEAKGIKKSKESSRILVRRIPIRTRILKEGDNIVEVVKEYTQGLLQPEDCVVVSESVVAITEGRAIPCDEIKIGPLARLLVRFVTKTPHGIGLGSPESMQAAITEVGRLRILLAAAAGAVGKLFGVKGWFYHVAGPQAALVDARGGTMPPYDRHVVLGPKTPEKTARQISRATGAQAAIVDVNDLKAAWVIGASEGVNRKAIESYLLDNPLGQTTEQTPIGIIRVERVSEGAWEAMAGAKLLVREIGSHRPVIREAFEVDHSELGGDGEMVFLTSQVHETVLPPFEVIMREQEQSTIH